MAAKFKWKKLANTAWTGTCAANGLKFICLIEKTANGFKTEGIVSSQSIKTDFFIKSSFTRATTARLGAERALNTFLAEYKARNKKTKTDAKPEEKEPLNRKIDKNLEKKVQKNTDDLLAKKAKEKANKVDERAMQWADVISCKLEEDGYACIGVIAKVENLKPGTLANAVIFGGGQPELHQKMAMFNILIDGVKLRKKEIDDMQNSDKKTGK